MFERVLAILDTRVDGRDALVLASRLTDDDGALVVAHVLDTQATPLADGARAAAGRREGLRDHGDEVYATLGPDPRVRYLPVSGLMLPEAANVLAERERSQIIVIGQNLLGRRDDAERLVARSPCPVVVAPYGYRFARDPSLARTTAAQR